MSIRRLIWILLFGLLALSADASPRTLVLVVRADSKVVDLDSLAVRKLFLGLPVLVNGSPLHPVRNRSDADLDPIFLQQIVAMSQAAYERQILIGVNRQGWLRPTEAASVAEVLKDLYADPNAVSFMWLTDVAHNPRVKVIRVLWGD
ncbi:MAG: hypothetical protein JSR66_17550 [Proteobacteria bacterium]|nr:hypothetical protein [Pseudomonadota bacterium]